MSGRTLSELKGEMLPHLNVDQAIVWVDTQDKLLWIEDNIFPLCDVQCTTNSNFGELLACWVEDQFEAMLGSA